MPAVTFELNAKEEGAVRGFLAVERSSDKAGKAVTKAGKEGASALEGFAKQALAVAGGAAAIKAAYDIMAADVKKNIAQMKTEVDELLKTLTGSGDLGKSQQIRAQLLGTHAPGLNLKARTEVFGSIRGALPTADLDEIMKIFRAVGAVGIKSGLGVEGTKDLAQTAGELAKVFSGKSAEDLVDIAKYTGETLGRRGQKFDRSGTAALSRLVAGGQSPEQALSLILAGAEAGVGPTELIAAADAVSGMTSVQQKKIKDPAAQARIAEIEKELGGIDSEQEKLRRAGVDDSTQPKHVRERRKAEREARIEELRRREYDLGEERKELATREVLAPLTEAEQQRNRIAAEAPENRLAFAIRNADLLRGALGSNASLLGAVGARDPGRFIGAIEEAQATDLATKRAREGVFDPRSQAAIAADIFAARADIARTGNPLLLKQQAAEDFLKARAREGGGGGVSEKAIEYFSDAIKVGGADPAGAFEQLGKVFPSLKGLGVEFEREYSKVGRVAPNQENSVVQVEVVNQKIPLGGNGRNAGDEDARPGEE